jgi:hypothetical protein
VISGKDLTTNERKIGRQSVPTCEERGFPCMEISTKINNFVENYLSTIEVDRMMDYSEQSKFGYLSPTDHRSTYNALVESVIHPR